MYTLVSGISTTSQIQTRTIQFDCDWTEETKDNYFGFLRQYRLLSGNVISAAIRLHQLKYSDSTGIPPVDYGVLLYYNTGNDDEGEDRSIYERSMTHRYTPSLRSYPLTLDIALPIFSPLPPAKQPGETKDANDNEDLMEIINDINHHSNHRIRNLIFFDLDSQNLAHYDKDIFQELLSRTE